MDVFKKPVRVLHADIARCGGARVVGSDNVICPIRDKCMRYLSPPHEYQTYLLIAEPAGADVNKCEELWEV